MKWLIEDRRQAYKDLESEGDGLAKLHSKTIGTFCRVGRSLYMRPLRIYVRTALCSLTKNLTARSEPYPMRVLWLRWKTNHNYVENFTATRPFRENLCSSCLAAINFEIRKIIYNESIKENMSEAEQAWLEESCFYDFNFYDSYVF